MAPTEISSVIKDIIDAFQNGLTIFKKSRGRRHRRRHSEPIIDADQRVRHSLSQRPQDIQRSYDQSVSKHGHQFEVGDSTSQTSLAQILLILNTGLIKLLNHALSHDTKIRGQSRNEILTLSESAAMDTLSALSELNNRLASASRVDLRGHRGLNDAATNCKGSRNTRALLTEASDADKAEQHTRQRASSSSQQPRRPSISPQLSKGGWIRSKSDPSVVSVVTSNRAAVKKNEGKRPPTSKAQTCAPTKTNPDLPATNKRSPPPVYSQLATKAPPQPKPKPQHLQAAVQQTRPFLEPIPEKQLQRHPSMYIVPSDFFDAFQTAMVARYEPQNTHQPQLPGIPLHSEPEQRLTQNARDGIRPRPPSMMTFMTASTKLGEIPDHKLPDRLLTDEQQVEIPMPYVIPDMLEQPGKKKKGFKFWKKQGGVPQAVAA